MDRLVTEIQNAYSQGNKVEGARLRESYERYFDLYTKYGGDPLGESVGGYTYSTAGGGAAATGVNSYNTSQAAKKREETEELIGSSYIANSSNILMNFYKDTSGNLIGSYYPDWGFDNHLAKLKVVADHGEYVEVEGDGWEGNWFIGGEGNTIDIPGTTNWKSAFVKKSELLQKYSKYATGGIVDYTGPAWVDGTPSKPEAFLSSSDTSNIAKLTDVLSKVFSASKTSSDSSSKNQNAGDIYYDFHITVEELGDGYSAEDMMKDMEKYIVQKSNYRNVINIGKRR